MSDWDTQWERAEQQAEEDMDMRDEEGRLVIGRITQVTETRGIPLSRAGFGSRLAVLPGGRIVSVPPMFYLYVYRQDGQAYMILTRADPFSYEHMSLTDFEMDVIMDWAVEMDISAIGRFTPADGGWLWWAE